MVSLDDSSASPKRTHRGRWPRSCCGVAFACAALACKEPAPPGRATTRGSVSGLSAPASASGKPPLDPRQTAAQALLTSWAAAQNSADFAAYSALYAQRFVGVKRVGKVSSRFNRRAWLADRKPMFAAGARIRVSQVQLTNSDDHVVVAFTQEFASPSYRDTGRKLLALVMSPEGLRIAREELLSSNVTGGGGSAAALPGFFAMMEQGVVLRSQLDDRWLTPERLKLSQAVRSPPSEEHALADMPEDGPLEAKDVRLPPEVLAMKGKPLFVTTAPAPGSQQLPAICETHVVAVTLASSATPAFESVRAPRQLDHAYGTFVLGKLAPACPGGLWASEAPPSAQYLPVPLTGPSLNAARQALRAQPEYAALQAEFRARSVNGVGDWDSPGATGFALGPGEGARLLFVVGYRYGDAEQSGRSLTLLFEQQAGSPTLRRRGLIDRNGFVLEPRLAFDLDHDGQLELLTAPSGDDSTVSVVTIQHGQLRSTDVFFRPDFVCPG
ncbi:MAG: nuclear transport factor 2 family protein [Polyangiaceae bacterium]